MTEQHPITPPPELVQQWFLGARAMPVDQWVTDVATKAARWGADQELEACCEWLRRCRKPIFAADLQLARRPKPPSLKEQAIRELVDIYSDEKMDGHAYNTIRRALEQLDG